MSQSAVIQHTSCTVLRRKLGVQHSTLCVQSGVGGDRFSGNG